MNKIAEAFAGGKAFIPFVTCGDPDLETTKALVRAMTESGADLIELGIPFSDPTAEGPVILGADIRALAGGVTTDRIFDMVEDLRREVKIPLVFMTYANVVFSYGAERFVKRMSQLKMDGLILPDVPFEEKAEFAPLCREKGISLISMVAPTSDARIARIASQADGFLYCVSSLGVTGMRSEIQTDIGAIVAQIRRSNPSVPVAIGFGISNSEQVQKMSALSDGVIVGSAIVDLIAKYGRDSVPYVMEFVREMKAAQRDLTMR